MVVIKIKDFYVQVKDVYFTWPIVTTLYVDSFIIFKITELIVLFKFCFLKSFYISYKEATLKVLNLNTMYIYF